MNYLRYKTKKISFHNLAIITMSLVMLPLISVILLFNLYTSQQQLTLLHDSRQNVLSLYHSQFENIATITENFLIDTVSNDRDFASIVYSRSKTEAYAASQRLGEKCKILSNAYTSLSGSFTYSKAFDCYRINYTGSYPQKDLAVLRAAVISASDSRDFTSGCYPISLSDRTVLLYTKVRNQTVFSFMIDPSRQKYTGLDHSDSIFYCLSDGSPLTSNSNFNLASIPLDKRQTDITLQNSNGQHYDLTMLPLSSIDGYIIYATPTVSLWNTLNLTQQILLITTLALLAFIPLSWIILRGFMIEPLSALTQTLHKIQNGHTENKVPLKSRIQEVNKIAETVNTMLDIIRQQKINFYEQTLENQQAQLQYLQLQIRPHFFLNCLNKIYSMASENKYADMQELILNLSTYLRGTFQRSAKFVALEDEIYSVNSYIHIQQIGTEYLPQLDFEIDADTSTIPIPPLSILTFVENSIKHSALINAPIKISIKCKKLISEDGSYLNITIRDNGTGFEKNMLDNLNGPPEDVYNSIHVGISNVKHRLYLLYNDKATLHFRNLNNGACVEIFLPLENKKEGIDNDSITGR